MRILAVDYGDARTGLAVSDPDGLIVGRAWTVSEWDAERLADTICKEAHDCGAERIVLGYPKNMDGTVGPRGEKCMAFKELLEENGCGSALINLGGNIMTVDRILSENGKRTKKHRKTVDAVAASLILEGYLQSIK